MGEHHGGDEGFGAEIIRRVVVGQSSGRDTLWNMQYSVDSDTGLLRVETPMGAAKNITITRQGGEHAGRVSNNVEMINSLEQAGFAMDTKEMPATEATPEGKRTTVVQQVAVDGAKKSKPLPVMMLDTDDGSLKSLGAWRDEEKVGKESGNAVLLMTAEGGQRLIEGGMRNHGELVTAVAQMTGQEPGAKR